MIVALMLIATIVASANVQFANQVYDDDRYYHDNDFDWHRNI